MHLGDALPFSWTDVVADQVSPGIRYVAIVLVGMSRGNLPNVQPSIHEDGLAAFAFEPGSPCKHLHARVRQPCDPQTPGVEKDQTVPGQNRVCAAPFAGPLERVDRRRLESARAPEEPPGQDVAALELADILSAKVAAWFHRLDILGPWGGHTLSSDGLPGVSQTPCASAP